MPCLKRGKVLIEDRLDIVLCDGLAAYSFAEKHSDRVRWQIMRIYRNRNLIIHNADSMPYLMIFLSMRFRVWRMGIH